MDDVQAKVEVLAEAALFDGRFEVSVGGGDDSHVDRDLVRSAQGTYGALLKHPEELRL
jgi:hypothetical protein